MQNRSNQKYSYSPHPLFPSDKWAGLSKQGVELEGPGKRICYKKRKQKMRTENILCFCLLEANPIPKPNLIRICPWRKNSKGNILKYRGGLSLIHPARCSRYTVFLSLFHCSVTAMKECYFWVTELCFSLGFCNTPTLNYFIWTTDFHRSSKAFKHLLNFKNLLRSGRLSTMWIKHTLCWMDISIP